MPMDLTLGAYTPSKFKRAQRRVVLLAHW
ncbi:rCG64282 [Rattus norvegicus]|uniref:RCG64282 n=1 Tax=Rattus norvegicus TaxID=10116 RepID=A6JGU6_RAT|nr:rCG64282 [Rattus norvegicus]